MNSTSHPTDKIIQIKEDAGQIEIDVPDRTVMLPSDLNDIRADFRGKSVLLSGKGPLWFYAHAAYQAVAGGGEEVRVFQHPAIEIPVYRRNAPTAPVPPWVQIGVTENGQGRISLHTTRDRREDPALLKTGGFALPAGMNSLTLTGTGANWMYAHLAAVAAAAGIPKLIYDAPKESGLISIGAVAPGTIAPRPGRPNDPGFVLGIAGDPNSGKSVFAKFLAGLIMREIPSSWTYDCDHSSPTPNWFVEGVSAGRESEVKPIREKQKRNWTPEMEARVASELKSLRENIPFTIADLPGGNHKVSPPRRIPAGREVILREVDAFVLLGRQGERHIRPAWREELEKHGLADRIIAEIDSANPELPLTLNLHQEAGRLMGTVSGLDRSNDLVTSVREIAAGENLLVRQLRAWKAAREKGSFVPQD